MTKELSSYVDRLEQQLDTTRIPRVTVAVLGATLALWVALLAGWVPMPTPTELPPSAPGAMEMTATDAGSVVAYLAMWGAMMSAMMYPAMLPFARRYVASIEADSATTATALATFFATYTLVWTATGVFPLTVDALVNIHRVVESLPAVVYGGMLLLVGGYQLSAFKHTAIRNCCGRVSVTDSDAHTAAKLGLRHGRSCVLATWHLFALLVLVGSMNVFWMAGLTAVIVSERLPTWGGEIADAVGVLAVVTGVVVLLPLPFPFP